MIIIKTTTGNYIPLPYYSMEAIMKGVKEKAFIPLLGKCKLDYDYKGEGQDQEHIFIASADYYNYQVYLNMEHQEVLAVIEIEEQD